MRIAFDIDNVLLDIIAAARTVLAGDIGIDPSRLEVVDVYDSPFKIRGDRLPIALDLSFWSDPRILSSCMPIDGSVEALRRAAALGLLCGYVTRRPPSDSVPTLDVMRRYYPEAPIMHVGTQSPETQFATCKSEACAEIGATHLVDDHAREIVTAHAAGVRMVVVDSFVGRRDRMRILSLHPEIPLVPDASDAVRLLTEGAGR